MSWFPPAFLLASGLLSLACTAWAAFLLFEIAKDVERVVAGLRALARRSANHAASRRRGAHHVQRQAGRWAEESTPGHGSVLLTLTVTWPHLIVPHAG